jgi:Tetracyclin repressor-like, C-terminal domain
MMKVEAPADDPLQRFRQFGRAYLRWAMKNPAHFEIISSGRHFDHDGAPGVSRDNAKLVALSGQMLSEALAKGELKGQLRSADLKRMQIAGRALVYGFARMNVDGHFPRWGVPKAEVERMGEAVIDLFIEGIGKR